jgi:secondary thiamine-phosphate synthase enzyme
VRQYHGQFVIETRGKGLYDLTHEVVRWLRGCRPGSGLLTLFVRHTSASLLIQENADPDVRHDLEAFLSRLVPEHDPLYRHRQEGPDDMPAHVRAALTQTHLSIPVRDGDMVLGTWQGIYLFEHRRREQRRQVVAHLLTD